MKKSKSVINGALFLAVSALLVIAPASLSAKEPISECSLSDRDISQAIKRSKKLMSTYILRVEEKMGITEQYGFALAVSVCGAMIWQAEYGYADLENSVPIAEDTKFRIGSVSKTLTSAALGQLVDAGKIDLDAEIQDYVPDYPRKAYPITVRQVAGHLAGIRHYNGDEFLSAVHYASVSDGLAIFKDAPLLHEPGSKFQYSSYGWNILSAVVEGASGISFLDYMEEHVFEPAGMTSTMADFNSEIIPHRAEFYQFDDEAGQNNNAPYVDLSNKWAGGGLLSTPADLLRFGHAMFDGTLVSTQTLSVLTASQSLSNGEETNYGIGWFTNMGERELQRAKATFSEEAVERIAGIIEDDRIVGHSGGSVGGLTLLLAAPESPGDVIVVGTSNNSAPILFPSFVLPVLAEFLDE